MQNVRTGHADDGGRSGDGSGTMKTEKPLPFPRQTWSILSAAQSPPTDLCRYTFFLRGLFSPLSVSPNQYSRASASQMACCSLRTSESSNSRASTQSTSKSLVTCEEDWQNQNCWHPLKTSNTEPRNNSERKSIFLCETKTQVNDLKSFMLTTDSQETTTLYNTHSYLTTASR